MVPDGKGLSADQGYLPAMVQGGFVEGMSKYSAISVLDRQNLDKVLANNENAVYSEGADLAQFGKIANAGYVMTGSITKTSTGYTLQMQIIDASSAKAETKASYSANCTVAELDNFSAIRKASADLLKQLGVTLNDTALAEVSGAAAANEVNAQTALARGITAEKRGTTVEAMTYYNMAAALDTSLLEAASRSSVMTANVSSGNIGADVRNDIQWRKDWVARLTETEQYFDNFFKTSSPSFGLFYSTDLQQGDVNYQTETVSVSFDANLHANSAWFNAVEKALQAVLDGLQATGKAKDWGLDEWPSKRVTNLNPFVDGKKSFSIVFELVNDKNQVIGRQTVDLTHEWSFDFRDGLKLYNNLSSNYGRYTVDDNRFATVKFAAVKANDITDSLVIRVAGVNGANPQTLTQSGAFSITAVPGEWPGDILTHRGVVRGHSARRQNERIYDIVIPENLWGDPITAIRTGAFGAFLYPNRTRVIIGANVSVEHEIFYFNYSEDFGDAYNRHGKRAGVYTFREGFFGRKWSYKPQ
ncbi:hypothetical protein FACS1894130_00550 [Spirochaetia bacterium]|nr:hypothetical protein FACS1894130_00550 [Spirochaetia bacterium]